MLAERLKVAIPLILLVILAFFLPGLPGTILFLLFAALMLFGATFEAQNLFMVKPFRRYFVPCILYGLANLALTALFGCNDAMALPLMVGSETLLGIMFILAIFVVSFGQSLDHQTLGNVGKSLATGFYICWCLNFIPKIYFMGGNSSLLLAYLVAVTKVADIGAYFVGSSTAKFNHKLSRNVSPKKSWEGLAGGIVFSLVVSWLFYHYLGDKMIYSIYGSPEYSFSCADAVFFGLVAPIVGLVGDLAESVLKRAAGAKDSGHVPGLGGVLDMLDSLIPMGPIFLGYFILKIA